MKKIMLVFGTRSEAGEGVPEISGRV